MKIDYFVAVDLRSFRDIIGDLGGVIVDVQNPVYDDHYPADDGSGHIKLYIPPGIQYMEGQEALAYARARHASLRLRPLHPPAAGDHVRPRAARPARPCSHPASSGTCSRRSGRASRPTSRRKDPQAHPARPGDGPGLAHLAGAGPARLQHGVLSLPARRPVRPAGERGQDPQGRRQRLQEGPRGRGARDRDEERGRPWSTSSTAPTAPTRRPRRIATASPPWA